MSRNAVIDRLVRHGLMDQADAVVLSDNPSMTSGGSQVDVVTGNTTLTAADNGKTIICNAADVVVTLPATIEGFTVTVITAVASGGTGTSVSPVAADQIKGNGFTAADNKDAINSGAGDAVGDTLTVVGDGTSGWWITNVIGTWAREA